LFILNIINICLRSTVRTGELRMILTRSIQKCVRTVRMLHDEQASDRKLDASIHGDHVVWITT